MGVIILAVEDLDSRLKKDVEDTGANSATENPSHWVWVAKALRDHAGALEVADELLHISMRGIASLTGGPAALRAIVEIDRVLAEPVEPARAITQSDMERAEKEAELARREIERDFPALHAQALVSLWGSLEEFIRSFVSGWLASNSAAIDVEEVQKLRVRLGEYVGKSKEEQCEVIVDLLQNELGAAGKRGVERFECLLKPFGWGGPVDPSVARDLYEMQQLRHVIVHRCGLADRRLVEACPWLSLSNGDRVEITHAQYARLFHALYQYFMELIGRAKTLKELELPTPSGI